MNSQPGWCPEVVVDFGHAYPDERSCVEDLARRRLDSGFACRRCGNTSFWLLRRRRLFHCKECAQETRITSGTIFHGTRVDLRKWYQLMYRLGTAHSGFSVAGLVKALDLASYRTGWSMVRKVCVALRERNARLPLLGLARFRLDRDVCGAREGLCAVSAQQDDAGRPLPVLAALSLLSRIGRTDVHRFLSAFEGGPNARPASELLRRAEAEGFLSPAGPDWLALYACQDHRRCQDKENREFALRVVQIADSAVTVSQRGVSPKHLDNYAAWACCVANAQFWRLRVLRMAPETNRKTPRTFSDMLGACIGARLAAEEPPAHDKTEGASSVGSGPG